MDSKWSIEFAKGKPDDKCKFLEVGNRFYSIGYFFHNYDIIFRFTIWDEDELEWKKIKYSEDQEENQVPEFIYEACVVAYKEFIYIWGGRFTFLYQFNTKKNKWTRPTVHGIIPQKRQNLTAVEVNGKMIIFGGENTTGSNYEIYVYSLDLKTFTWDILLDSPSFDLFYYKLIDFGVKQDRFVHFIEIFGYKSESKKPKIIYFDLLQKEWNDKQIVQEFPEGKRVIEAYNLDGIFYLFCSDESSPMDCLDALYLFNPATGNVIKKIIPPQESTYFGSFKIEGKIAMFLSGWMTFPNDYLSIEQEEEFKPGSEKYFDFILYMDLKYTDLFNLQSLCFIKILHSKLDTSKLPKRFQDKFAKF